MSKHKGHIAGLAAGAGTGAGLAGATAALSGPAAHLGGLRGRASDGGPALSTAIAAVGGPVVAGAAVAAGVGYGAYRVAKWIFG